MLKRYDDCDPKYFPDPTYIVPSGPIRSFIVVPKAAETNEKDDV